LETLSRDPEEPRQFQPLFFKDELETAGARMERGDSSGRRRRLLSRCVQSRVDLVDQTTGNEGGRRTVLYLYMVVPILLPGPEAK
jgi:hypothetical protein